MFYFLDQSSNEPFSININNSDSYYTNTLAVPLENYSEENQESTITIPRKKTRNLNKWIIFTIILLLLIIISISTVIITKLSSNKNLSGLIYSFNLDCFIIIIIIVVIPIKKVLFVIADGIPADVIENLNVTNIRKLGTYKRSFVGGEIGSYSETPTISAPGYINLLSGTWANKHNVYSNNIENPNYNYKNIFRLLKEQDSNKKIGIYSTWIDNRIKLIGEGLSKAGNIIFDYKYDGYELDLINYPHDSFSNYIKMIDQRVINESSNSIKKNSPDLSWIYLQYTDDIGHLYGDSELFKQSIIYLDQLIGQIYDSIQYRMKFYNEDWLFILTTDHGRDLITGKNHKNQSERERTTWITTNYQNMNNYFYDFIPAIVDILPTIATFMNIKIPYETQRELDGVSLIGNVSLIQPNLVLNENNLTIKWKSLDNTGNVNIWLTITNLFKDGLKDNYTLVKTVPIENQIAIINLNEYPSTFYKIVLEGKYNIVNKWILRS